MVKQPPNIAQKVIGNNKYFLLIPTLLEILVIIGNNNVTVPILRMNPAITPENSITSKLILLGFSRPTLRSHFATTKLMPEFSKP